MLVGGGGPALGGGNVWTALEQLRGHADRHLGQREIERRRRNAEVGEILVGDGADGVFELGARHADIYELRADGFKLGRAWATSASVADSAGETALGEVELVFEIGDGGR